MSTFQECLEEFRGTLTEAQRNRIDKVVELKNKTTLHEQQLTLISKSDKSILQLEVRLRKEVTLEELPRELDTYCLAIGSMPEIRLDAQFLTTLYGEISERNIFSINKYYEVSAGDIAALVHKCLLILEANQISI